MADVKPKVVILAPQTGAIQELEELLGDRIDIVHAESLGPKDADARYVITPADPSGLGTSGLGDHERDMLLGCVGEALCLVTADGKLLWSNRTFGTIQSDMRTSVISAAAKAAASFLGKQIDDRKHPPMQRVVIESAEGRVFELRISPMLAEGAAEMGDRVVGVIRDITSESQFKQKMNAIDEAGTALSRLDRDAVRDMNAPQRLRLLEERIVKAAHDLLNYDHFAIRLLDQYTGRLETVISLGFPDEAIELELYPAEEGNGIIGFVAATGDSHICRDTEADSRFLPGASGARSSLTVPLKIENKIIGVLDIESLERDAFDANDLQFAQIFARYIAIALQMLDMLVIERSATGQTITSRFEGEIDDPLKDILTEIGALRSEDCDAETASHLDRIRADVQSIRDRMQEMSDGPNTLLGLDKVGGADKADPRLVGKRILVADDQPRIRQMIADILRRRGCDVVACDSGQAAINELEASTAEGSMQFDVVISDISMPDRNGYEVFAVARGVIADEAIILMTGFGYDPHHSIVRASQQGMQHVLYKPFQATRLLDEVHRAVDAGGCR
ncbi:MAG: response regulator [Planctomycetota bacterium]